MSRTNEAKHIKSHKTCKCKCRLDTSVCDNKQRWNNDKFRCECKELIDKGMCDEGSIWNPSNCKCECDKLCNVWEYSDYKNCKCRKRLINKVVKECSENIDENWMIYNSTLNAIQLNDYSWTVHIVLLVIFFIMSISISSVFIHFHFYLKRRYTETTIYWMQFHWRYKLEMLKK